MIHPLVVHCKREFYDVYIGRGPDPNGCPERLPKVRLSNDFTHLPLEKTLARIKVDTVENAVKAYELWARGKLEVDPEWREEVRKLYGKRLGCWCKGKYDVCHGNVLVQLSEELNTEAVRAQGV